MKVLSVPALGAFLLAALFAGCAGGQTSLPAAAPAALLSSSNARFSSLLQSSCTAVSISQNFNKTAISPGSSIWFSSQMSVPNYRGPLTVTMWQSRITFKAGQTNYTIDGPNMKVSLNSGSTFRFRFTGLRDDWRLRAPNTTSGNDFLNGIGYNFQNGLVGGLTNVTWTAKFVARDPHEIRWQWGAAVYTTFNSKYGRLDVKALDDKNYPPYNSDKAGTPEAYKQYLTAGATSSGGDDYTGTMSRPTTVTPCQR